MTFNRVVAQELRRLSLDTTVGPAYDEALARFDDEDREHMRRMIAATRQEMFLAAARFLDPDGAVQA